MLADPQPQSLHAFACYSDSTTSYPVSPTAEPDGDRTFKATKMSCLPCTGKLQIDSMLNRLLCSLRCRYDMRMSDMCCVFSHLLPSWLLCLCSIWRRLPLTWRSDATLVPTPNFRMPAPAPTTCRSFPTIPRGSPTPIYHGQHALPPPLRLLLRLTSAAV